MRTPPEVPMIQYTPDMRIVNVESLPKCKGAKYLETLRAHNGDFIAAQWRRKAPESLPAGRVIIKF